MMGARQEVQPALFYEFSLEDHVPQNHLLRSIDRFVDLSGIRTYLADFYSDTGRPSVDPELLIRMLLVGYRFGIRSELCLRIPSCSFELVCPIYPSTGKERGIERSRCTRPNFSRSFEPPKHHLALNHRYLIVAA